MLRKTILIIEDDEDIRENLKDLLESEGLRVSSACNGKAALELLENEHDVPSLILLDLMMPIMDGREFLEILKTKYPEKSSNIPIVIISAGGRIYHPDAQDFLQKPVDVDDLLELIDKYYKRDVA